MRAMTLATVFLSACVAVSAPLAVAQTLPGQPAGTVLPTPSYPPAAIAKRLNGKCEMTIDLSKSGDVSNIRAACTDPAFCDESIEAMKRARLPQVGKVGEAPQFENVSYPLEYQISGARLLPRDAELTRCDAGGRPVS